MSELHLVDEPYPGLRSFRRDETHIFFGREGTINDMVHRLAAHRFLAVTGTSGSGKSSLVRTGLLDALDRGLLASAGADWRVADFRPGRRPLAALADALLEGTGAPASEHESLRVEALLARGPYGLVEWLKETDFSPQTNLLLLADQFEEIFRFRYGQTGDDIDAFVALLLASARQRERPIYVVITMRSDFLGECSQFSGLAEAVNDGQYLTPRLTREQCQSAIEGPAAVFEGRVERSLVNRLLNDMATNADQLPLVQHVLMRLWRMASRRSGDEAGVLKLSDYLKLGGIGNAASPQPVATAGDIADSRGVNALSAHADEILSELTPRQRRLAAILFRALTESEGAGGRDVRHPIALSEVAEIADVPPAEFIPVVDAFRAPGRNLLTPPSNTPLEPETVIDISHESLIRQWITLRKWLREEYDAAQTYRHVETSAKLWRQGQSGLMTMPYLGVARAWRERELPNAFWASRYGDAFDAAMEYLDKSLEAEQQRIAAEEAARRKTALRTRTVAVAMAVLALVAGAFAYVGFISADQAQQERQAALQAQKQAIANEELAERSAELAKRSAAQAEQSAKEAQRQREEAQKASAAALVERDRALFGQSVYLAELSRKAFADGQFLRSLLLGVEALPDRRWKIERPEVPEAISILARTYHQLAVQQALLRRERTRFMRFLPSGDRVVTVSASVLGVWDTGNGSGIAQDAGHVGLITDHDVSSDGKLIATAGHDGTIRVLDAASGRLVTRIIQHGTINVLKFRTGHRQVVAGGADAVIQLWDFDTRQVVQEIKTEVPVEALTISADGSQALIVTRDSRDKKARLLNLANGAIIKEMGVPDYEDVRRAFFTPDGSRIIVVGSYKQLAIWDAKTLSLIRNIKVEESFRPVAVSRDGTRVAVGTYFDNKLTSEIFDTRTGAKVATLKYAKEIYDLVFTSDGTRLITGSTEPGLRIWDAKTGEQVGNIDVPENNNIRFVSLSDDGTKLASLDFAGNLRFFEPNTGRSLGGLLSSNSSRSKIELGSQGHRALWIPEKGPVIAWDVRARKQLATLVPTGEVDASAFSPDDRWLALASKDGSTAIWETGNFTQSGSINARATALSFSPDRRHLAASVNSVELSIHDDGKSARNIGREEPAFAMTFGRISVDGRWFFVGGDGPLGRLWNLDTGALQKIATDPGDTLVSVYFNNEGTRVVTATKNGRVRLLDTQTGAEVATLATDVLNFSFSLLGHRVALRSRDGTIRVWDTSTGKLLVQGQRPAEFFRLNDDGSRLIAWKDSSLEILDVGLGRRTAAINLSASSKIWAYLSPDGRRVVYEDSADSSMTVANAVNGRQIAKLSRRWSNMVDVSARLNRDGSRIIVKEVNGNTEFYDTSTGARIAEIEEPVPSVRYEEMRVQFSSEGDRFLFFSKNGQIDLWDAQEGKRVAMLSPARAGGRLETRFSGDSKLVAIATGGPSVRLLDARTGKPQAELGGHPGTVKRFFFSPDSRRLVAVTESNSAIRWDVASAAKLNEFRVPSADSIFYYSDDGKRIITVLRDTSSLILETGTWREAATVRGRLFDGSAFSADGARVATIAPDNIVRISEVASGRELSLLKGHTNQVMRAVFSPDGTLVLTVSKDKTARLWNVRSGAEIVKLEGHANEVVDGYFNRDGTRVVTISEDSSDYEGRRTQVWLWRSDNGARAGALPDGMRIETIVIGPDAAMAAAFSATTMAQFDLSTGKVLHSMALDTSSRGEFDFIYSPFNRLVSSRDGSVIGSQQTGAVWRMPWTAQDHVDLVKEMLPRCLTEAERKEIYLNPDPPDWCIEMGKWPYDTAEWRERLTQRRAAGPEPAAPQRN